FRLDSKGGYVMRRAAFAAGLVALMLGIAAPAGAAPARAPRDIDTITVDDGPTGIDVNTTTDRIYVADFRANHISVIDGATDTVLDTAQIGGEPFGVAVDPGRNIIYVGNLSTASVAVINGRKRKVVDTISDPTIYGSNVALDRPLHLLYVTGMEGPNDIIVIDTTTN